MSKQQDLVGMVVGKLTVIERLGSRPRYTKTAVFWRCVCECGNYVETVTNVLKQGDIKSCGCVKLSKGEAAKNAVILGYKNGAKSRDLNFCLSVVECENLFQGRCYYCNCLPTNVRKLTRSNGTYSYNGIDRIDNNKDYTIENCVSCCKMCNRLKSNLSVAGFLTKIADIYHMRVEYNV